MSLIAFFIPGLCACARLTPAEPKVQVVAGDSVDLSVATEGSVGRVDWTVADGPEDCRGTLSPHPVLPRATFTAPSNCTGTNIVRASAFGATAQIDVRITSGIPSPPAPPSSPVSGPADSPGTGTPQVVPDFANETYMEFAGDGFLASFRLEADRLAVHLEAPRHSGFGGVCVSTGRPVDLRRHTEMVVDYAGTAAGHVMEFKLERLDSKEGTAIVQDVISVAGRKTEVLSLGGLPDSIRSATSRFCVAMNASKFGPPQHRNVR